MKYHILRPPLDPDFELPSRDELLIQKPGNSVKLIFKVGDEVPERMWVTVTSNSSSDQWRGTIDNDATQPKTLAALPVGEEVSFHPLDIIAVYDVD